MVYKRLQGTYHGASENKSFEGRVLLTAIGGVPHLQGRLRYAGDALVVGVIRNTLNGIFMCRFLQNINI